VGPPPEPEAPRKAFPPWAIAAAAAAAIALAVFVVPQFVSCDSKPAAKGDQGRPRPSGKRGQKAPPEAPKTETEAAREAARLDALARKGPKEAEEVVKQCEAFLQRFGTDEHAEAVKKLRDTALAVQRDREAEGEFRALQTTFRDKKKPFPQRLEEIDAFLKAYAGTKAAAQATKLREQTLAEREAAADRALVPAKRDLDKHLKAEAYGPAIEVLTGLADSYAGSKVGAAAAAQAAELRQKLATEMKEKLAAADALLRRAAFGEAIGQLDAPLKAWQFDPLRREAADFVASARQRRGKIVQAYGTFLTDLNALAGSWKLEEARAAAAAAAAKAGDPVLRQLLEAKAAEMAALLRARARIVAGAKAEEAKAAAGDGRLWLQRISGARLKAAIANPTDAGLDADMPGYKGHVGWADLHVDQLLLFAHSAPGEATAADLVALGLLALRAGDMQAAFQEFTKAAETEPSTLDAAAGFLRHHAQGFVFIPGGQFAAGPKKEPATLDAFLLARAEVTNAEFAFFARATKAQVPPDWKVGLDDHPVANITWAQADAYARWLDLRLPTDLEWERAVRGAEGRLYPWGDKFEAGRANLARTSTKGPLMLSQLLPAYRHLRRDDSPFFHLVGNVREWTSTPSRDPKGALLGYATVGGSAADPEAAALPYARVVRKADARDPHTGFRLAWPR
jgi:formylglycine-generating enzyme required for sulfatase activity